MEFPEAQLACLRHLELANCLESFVPSRAAMSVHTLLAVIRNCPNLETLRVEGLFPRNTWLGSEVAVNVSRLRRLTLRTPLECTLALFSYLALPLTASLDLKPSLAHEVDPLFLSTSIVTPLGLPPTAEVALHLKSTIVKNDLTWETQGDGSRPLRFSITLYNNSHIPDGVLGRTNEVLAIFAPGTAVTSLTVTSGRSLRREAFWTGLLAGLPSLTVHLVVDAGPGGDYPRILPLLGHPQGDGRCLCPALTNLSVLWDPQSDPEEGTGLAAENPQTAIASASVGPSGQPWTLAAASRAYCRVVQQCLRSRADHGYLPLQSISISIWRRVSNCEAAVEAELREGLKGLIEKVSVIFRSK